MNFKIENNFLNITNYPYIEKRFEDRASQGWLISKIIGENIFIYKKIKPEKLEFSISPYEIETAFTRKSKEDLEEFQSVCESVGWNFGLNYGDFHIYFKEEGRQTVEIETDQEEEFKTLEKIGKKEINGLLTNIGLFIFLIWINIYNTFSQVRFLKDGLSQIVLPMLIVFVISQIDKFFKYKKFLKKNKRNIELGDNIEFLDSKMYIQKISSIIQTFILILFFIYIIYNVIFLRQKLILGVFIPILAVFPLAYYFRNVVKPSKKTLKFKKKAFIGIFLITFLTISWLGIVSIYTFLNKEDSPNIRGLKVMSIDDFQSEKIEEEGSLSKNISILVPESYDYYSFGKNYQSVATDYSKVLTERIGEKLLQRYLKDSEKLFQEIIRDDLEYGFQEGEYDENLQVYGFMEEDFISLYSKGYDNTDESVDEAIDIMISKTIVEDTDNLWEMDQAYFLSPNKEEIVIRKGKEVILLRGQDFEDPEIIKIVKEKLKL